MRKLPIFAALLLLAAPVSAAPVQIAIPDASAFPESMTSTADGTLIIGSYGQGMIFRAKPGATAAEPWIKPGTNGLWGVLGVLADAASNTLWVCSDKAQRDVSPLADKRSAVKTFDLKTGAAKASYPFPESKDSLCNDIAIGSDGTAYVTDMNGQRILRLKHGAAALDVWAQSSELTGLIDGIAFGDAKTLYVNALDSGRLYRIALNADGGAGKITLLHTSRPLKNPDGMRPVGNNRFLLVEGSGRLDLLTIRGDDVDVVTLKDGLAGPTGTTAVKDLAWVVEGKLDFLFDPKLRGQNPGPFFTYGVPWHSGR